LLKARTRHVWLPLGRLVSQLVAVVVYTVASTLIEYPDGDSPNLGSKLNVLSCVDLIGPSDGASTGTAGGASGYVHLNGWTERFTSPICQPSSVPAPTLEIRKRKATSDWLFKEGVSNAALTQSVGTVA
jgi:hypothetical protein